MVARQTSPPPSFLWLFFPLCLLHHLLISFLGVSECSRGKKKKKKKKEKKKKKKLGGRARGEKKEMQHVFFKHHLTVTVLADPCDQQTHCLSVCLRVEEGAAGRRGTGSMKAISQRWREMQAEDA
ncbi:hypothetical protein JOB18_017548 [Solea senegalensis]|uniref:Secreted protein n=1 Tax=Solea senegalensis TaxID=28829 RepID=A0AAV6RLB3_SOLSE|nr:hypothetical protein JOB18_017548 [Solea senegalensis]KAG7504797.1 hypothetical protein JOB18_017548 [Solea senegalensis]